MSPQVLMVENDPATAEQLAEALIRAGCSITLVEKGTEAFALLQQKSYAVVLSKLALPLLDGLKLLEAVREKANRPEVVLLADKGCLDSALHAWREGAFDYLTQPYEPANVVRRVCDAIAAYEERQSRVMAVQHVVQAFSEAGVLDYEAMPSFAAGHAQPNGNGSLFEPVFQVGELRIGTAHHDVSFAGTLLHVTPTEYALLRTMAGNPGRVFSYCELVYAMHGYETNPIEAKILLKTHVRNLRRKIGAGYLVNVRSTGYKLIAP